jgi:superfamily II DNA or RNA helicase
MACGASIGSEYLEGIYNLSYNARSTGGDRMLETGPMDLRQAGLRVRHRQNPSKAGLTTGEVRFSAGRDVAAVSLDNGETAYFPTDQIELVPETESRLEAFESGRTTGPKELARLLLTSKIGGELTDIYYSMGTGKADFHPHQFRPVLKFVQSANRRILIADEVGLGKTISAIYIWKELQARGDARRLLILCPAALREKWRYELLSRFSIEAQNANAQTLAVDLDASLRDSTTSFVRIASFEGLRAKLGDDEEPRTPQQRLLHLFQDNAGAESALFDLTIADEAHAARNPETANHHLLSAVRDTSASLVLLTATPLQTHSENLYNLLKLVDPDRFVSFDTFEQARRANIPIVEALNALLRTPADREAFQRNLERAVAEPLLQNDQLLADIVKSELNWSPDHRIQLARSLEARSLLADVMVRTRKREAFLNRVIRSPWVLNVSLSAEERHLYAQLSNRIRALARKQNPGTPGEFVLISRQRQLASCIPAALEAWRETGHLDEVIWEDLGVELPIEGDTSPVVDLDGLLSGYDFETGDSKYRVFSDSIKNHLMEHPNEKIVVFAYFRGTLRYLQRRLESDGVSCALIMGGMGTETVDNREVDRKTLEIERFRAVEGPSVLLSSEVGSEGIDLQFARIVFNYDLPWNPMRVEQRIGRIDRMGQTADRVIIGHFATDGTIDDRILNRLYDRINVFRESIGDLDEIFGEKVQSILREYFRGELSPDETEQRLDQNELSQASTGQTAEELKNEASALAGFSHYILSSIDDDYKKGRYVRPKDLCTYATDFLNTNYPGSQIEYDPQKPTLFKISLSTPARDELATFIAQQNPSRRTRLFEPGATVSVQFDPTASDSTLRRIEVIDVSHPLILWIKHRAQEQGSALVPAFVAELNVAKCGQEAGLYVFATDMWRLDGVQKRVTLRHASIEVQSGRRLSKEEADNLIGSAAEFGEAIRLSEIESDHSKLLSAFRTCESNLVDEFLAESHEFRSENDTRIEQGRQLVNARADRVIRRLQEILDLQSMFTDERRRRILPATQARLRHAREDRDLQLARLDRQGRTDETRRPLCGGLVVVSNA